MEPIATLESRESRRLASLAATKECREGPIQSTQWIAECGGVELDKFRSCLLDTWHLRRLHVPRHPLPTFPRPNPLFERRIVQLAAHVQQRQEFYLLRFRWVETDLVGQHGREASRKELSGKALPKHR
jgi:hypothetical protein